ncbi:MAG: hypothetical protein RLZZ450_6965 [Pseudomonadota bacterium]|jgi:hypothetical protein
MSTRTKLGCPRAVPVAAVPVCVVLSCLLGAGCSDALSFPRSGDKVSIPASYERCEDGQACTLTGADCSDCCGVAAVRSESEESIYVAVQRSCQSYQGPHCLSCSAIPREAVCVDGRCTLIHSTTCNVSGSLRGGTGGAMPVSPGTEGLKDPFSCNTCTCQQDGTLLCGKDDCPVPCSLGLAPGTTCDSCGYNEHCDVTRTACLPSCETNADCGGTPGGVCSAGVCKRICGQ